MQTVAQAHDDLIRASQEIGSACESAAWFTYLLAEDIAERGREVDTLTVGELRALLAARSEQVQRECGAGEEDGVHRDDWRAGNTATGD
jgi:hypothetical protein